MNQLKTSRMEVKVRVYKKSKKTGKSVKTYLVSLTDKDLVEIVLEREKEDDLFNDDYDFEASVESVDAGIYQD